MNGEMDLTAHLLSAEEFRSLLAREELRRGRTGELLAVAILDIDGLRQINARHGADAGSEAIALCAETLTRTLRSIDDVGRTGPDEFSVLLHATDARQANAWADRFESVLEGAAAGHSAGELTCSVGIADTVEEETLIEAAARARRRMEVVQAVRKLRRQREGGGEPAA
jgi:diguanylate cyclase (GGDEF)-like protein